MSQGGAKVSTATTEGWTALHLAAKDRHLQVVNLLLEAGADASTQDAHGCTALHFAARIADMALFQMLYKHPTSQPGLQSPTGRVYHHRLIMLAVQSAAESMEGKFGFHYRACLCVMEAS